MMKRGCEDIFVHIHNKTLAGAASLEKVNGLVETLTEIQLDSKLYVVPFEKIQKAIVIHVPADKRMIVYRRFMTRILSEIAKGEGSKTIVTGDSVGQVASQTLDNLSVIRKSSDLTVLSPLIGLNKEEIVDIAKKVGTYEKSIVPYPDCCSFMIAQRPETRSKLKDIEELEKKIKDSEDLIKDAIEKAKTKIFTFQKTVKT